jgi:hypothetical protein
VFFVKLLESDYRGFGAVCSLAGFFVDQVYFGVEERTLGLFL